MPIRLRHVPRALFVSAMIVGLLVGFGVHRMAAKVELDRAQAHLELQTAAAAFAIDSHLTADLEVLFAVRSLFESGVPVTPEGFARIARSFLARNQNLLAVEWMPRVGREERHILEQQARDDIFNRGGITEQVVGTTLGPTDERDSYYPVVYIEPLKGNERALGFDVGSDRLRRAAMDRTAATGKPALTDPISLVQGNPAAKEVLGLMAVFDDESESPDVISQSLSGFILAVYDFNGLLDQAWLGSGHVVPPGIRFELVDEDVDGRPLHIHTWLLESLHTTVSGLSAERSVEVGGQRWQLTARPTAAYLKPLRTRRPQLLGTAAAFVSVLLVGGVAIFAKRTRYQVEGGHSLLLKNVLESLGDGVIVANTAGRILMANRAATTISGQGATDTPASAWSEEYGFFEPRTQKHFPPDDLPLARAIRGESTSDVEILVRNSNVPNGTYVSVSGSPLLNKEGSVRGGVVVIHDISERRQATERLQRLSNAVEQTADSVLITDRLGTIEYVNPAFEATTGYSSSEVVGKNPNILKSGNQTSEYYHKLWTTVLRGEPFRGPIVNRKKNGELYHAEQTISGIKDDEGRITHLVSVYKDMTERRKVQALDIEIELASMVQQRLYPASPPLIAGYDVAGRAFSAAATCGDYFDFIPMLNSALGIVTADVSGHGLGPALVMAETRAYLRSLTQATDDVESIATAVNRFLVADLHENFFVTMIFAKLEPDTGRLTFVNAAHPNGFIISSSGQLRDELASASLPIGLWQDRWQCSAREVVVGAGDLLVLVTDGFLESESGDGTEFGADRLRAVVARHRRRPAQEIIDLVYKEMRGFVGDQKQQDDATIVICKRHPAPQG